MLMTNVGSQVGRHFMYDASGTITSGGTAQLIVPEQRYGRSYFLFENISDTDMYLEIGFARATATLTSGVVSSIAVANAGFNYNTAPTVKFYGGGDPNNAAAFTPGIPGYPSPQGVVNSKPARPARAHCVMTGSAGNLSISSIVVDDGGAGYINAPYVFLENHLSDPMGCAVPSATSGILVKGALGASYTNNGVVCTTDPIAVYCASSSKAYTFKYTL